MNKKQFGFTIIELIVVIAIIAVLAGIVLVNVTQYINKAKDAAMLANLDNLLKDSNIYVQDHNNFAAYETSKTYVAIKQALLNMGYGPDYRYKAVWDAWCLGIVTKAEPISDYCVDSTGILMREPSYCSMDSYVCVAY